jgi:ELWxxDGT repeat protein
MGKRFVPTHNQHIQQLESRHLLSVTLIHESTTSSPASLFAGSDGMYAGGWSTDGSHAGQRGPIGNNTPFFFAWNGGMITQRRPSSYEIVEFSSGRENPFSQLSVTPTLRASFAPERAVKIGRWTYFMTDHEILRTRGDVSSATTVLHFSSGVRLHAIARVGASDRFCFIRDSRDNLELWVSDGTLAGTSKLRVIGDAERVDPQLLAAGPYVFFGSSSSGSEPIEGTKLWRTDGTLAGTVKVADIRPGRVTIEPDLLRTLDNRVLLTAHDGSGYGLWASDGTAAGTQKLLDGFPALSRNLNDVARVGKRLFFFGPGPVAGAARPWVTDGTPSGTHAIDGVLPDRDLNKNHMMVAMNGRVYFNALFTGVGEEIWRTDATGSSATRVANVGASMIHGLAAFNGAVYFSDWRFGNGTGKTRIFRTSDESISINGYVFDDADADAGRDAGERALVNVRIYVDANHNRAFDAGERSTLSDVNGRYAFRELSAGTYRLRQVAPAGARETSPSYVLTLAPGDHAFKTFGSVRGGGMIDGRIRENAIVGGGIGGLIVYLDTNGDARRQKTESATTTDEAGRYAFQRLERRHSHGARRPAERLARRWRHRPTRARENEPHYDVRLQTPCRIVAQNAPLERREPRQRNGPERGARGARCEDAHHAQPPRGRQGDSAAELATHR